MAKHPPKPHKPKPRPRPKPKIEATVGPNGSLRDRFREYQRDDPEGREQITGAAAEAILAQMRPRHGPSSDAITEYDVMRY